MSQGQDWNPPGDAPSYQQPQAGQGYPPPQGPGYPPQGPGYPPPSQGFPPPSQGFPPQGPGYPPVVYGQQLYPQGPGYGAPPVMQVMPKNAALAIILSFFIPGVGSIYAGRTTTGVIILVCYIVSWVLVIIIIGFVGVFGFWVWGMIDAFLAAQEWNRAHGIES